MTPDSSEPINYACCSTQSQELPAGKTFSLVGTAYYLAPEMIAGEGHSYPADWWSVGVIMFELLTGCRPFDGDSEEAVMDLICNADISSILTDDPESEWGISAESAEVLRRLLERDPE